MISEQPRAKIVILIILLLSVLLTGCPPKQPPTPMLTRLPTSAYPDFFDDLGYNGLEQSIQQSLLYLKKIPKNRVFEFGNDKYEAGHIIRSLEEFLVLIQRKPASRELNDFIRSKYAVYRMLKGDDPEIIRFTGYYEPLMQGRSRPDSEFRFPVYARPSDLITVDLSPFGPEFQGKKITGRLTGQTMVPYYDRKEIEQSNVLEGKAEPLLWVNDRVGLFFLQIQGSGKIELDNGETINIHYNAQNGRPFRSIGKYMIEQGKLSSGVSMQKIRQYLKDHPEETDEILFQNPSFVFFSIEPEGPLGALNVVLTPGRSIAVDRKIYPMSALSFIETQKPVLNDSGQIAKWIECSRFVLNQDTGGAITGPGRVDFFWGNGEYAEIAAGHMNQEGTLYILVLKP